jgi:cytochrome c oxidase subunit II
VKILHSALIVLGLAFAAPTLAQDAAPASPSSTLNTTAPLDAPATAQPAPKVEAPAPLAPEAGIGQPVPKGFALQEQVTKNGEFATWMHDIILMPIITLISLFVLGLLLWVIVRYRRAANPVPSKTSHNTLIEVIWTLVPVLILVGIAIPSIGLLARQYAPVPAGAVTIKAVGNQWFWTYQYPDHGGFELISNMLSDEEAARRGEPRLLAVDNRVVVPVGTPIRLLTTSNDVLHAWAIPAFWVKMDAVPGRINEVSFTVEKPGVYYGQCSELCGAKHGFMPIAVEAVPPAQFAQWVASQGGTMPGAAAPAAAGPTQGGTKVAPAGVTPTGSGSATPQTTTEAGSDKVAPATVTN